MVKEYEMTGACPIIVYGFGRVEPGAKPFRCEMESEQEAFFLKIGAVRVRSDAAGLEPTAPHPRAGGKVEYEGRTLDGLPASWPRRGEQEETVEDFVPESER